MIRIPRIRIIVSRGRFDQPSSFVLLSLAAHAAAIGAIGAAASLVAQRGSPPPDPGFFVSLAELPPGGGSTTPQPSEPAAAVPKKAAEKKEPPKAERKKEVLLPDKPAEQKAHPARIPEAEGKEPKPGQPSSPSSPESPGGIPGAAAGPGVPGGEGGVISLDIPNFEHAWYTARVVALLKSHWVRPHLQEERALAVTVSFTIHRNGSVEEVNVETTSGFDFLDRSAIRAVQDSSPLPPLPALYTEQTLTARIVFEVTPES